MIEIRNVSIIREGVYILKGVSLSIKKGEFVAIVGPNGAGKTTLLDVITGFIKPTEGVVVIKNKRTDKKIFTGENIGYVFQEEYSSSNIPLTVEDVVSIGGYKRGGGFFHLKGNPGLIDKALEEVGISNLKHRNVSNLSGGERRKVSIARELSRQVDALLLDEVLANLDPPAQIDINGLIQRLHEELGITIVFVTHLLHYLPERVERIVGLKNGEVLFDKPRNKITGRMLAELYGCDEKKLSKYVGTFRV